MGAVNTWYPQELEGHTWFGGHMGTRGEATQVAPHRIDYIMLPLSIVRAWGGCRVAYDKVLHIQNTRTPTARMVDHVPVEMSIEARWQAQKTRTVPSRIDLHQLARVA